MLRKGLIPPLWSETPILILLISLWNNGLSKLQRMGSENRSAARKAYHAHPETQLPTVEYTVERELTPHGCPLTPPTLMTLWRVHPHNQFYLKRHLEVFSIKELASDNACVLGFEASQATLYITFQKTKLKKIVLFFLKTESHVAQAGLELLTILLQFPKCWE